MYAFLVDIKKWPFVCLPALLTPTFFHITYIFAYHYTCLLCILLCSQSLFQRNTEGRISIVHHEVVPNYMRTKLDLDLEAKQKELAERVTDKGAEVSAEIKKFNEMLSSSLERVTEVREELDDQKSKTGTCVRAQCNGAGWENGLSLCNRCLLWMHFARACQVWWPHISPIPIQVYYIINLLE